MVPGVVVAFAGKTAPAGWLACDGRSLNSTDRQYARLYAAIGTIHGGDANPNFQLPDYRGYFLRGVDAGAGRDPDAPGRKPPGKNNTGTPGDAVGSIQDDGVGPHSHTVDGAWLQASGGMGFQGFGFESNSGGQGKGFGTHNNPGSETRPKNANVMYIIML